MNPKIEKAAKEISKIKEKVAELQARQRDLERQKMELENIDIVAAVRSLNLSPQELSQFIRTQTAGAIGVLDTKSTLQEAEDRNHEN